MSRAGAGDRRSTVARETKRGVANVIPRLPAGDVREFGERQSLDSVFCVCQESSSKGVGQMRELEVKALGSVASIREVVKNKSISELYLWHPFKYLGDDVIVVSCKIHLCEGV